MEIITLAILFCLTSWYFSIWNCVSYCVLMSSLSYTWGCGPLSPSVYQWCHPHTGDTVYTHLQCSHWEKVVLTEGILSLPRCIHSHTDPGLATNTFTNFTPGQTTQGGYWSTRLTKSNVTLLKWQSYFIYTLIFKRTTLFNGANNVSKILILM